MPPDGKPTWAERSNIMSVKSPTHASAALPPGAKPSLDMNELLIRKFLKSCKKEEIDKVFEKSAEVREFETPGRKDKIRRKINKQRAIRQAKEAESLETKKSKR